MQILARSYRSTVPKPSTGGRRAAIIALPRSSPRHLTWCPGSQIRADLGPSTFDWIPGAALARLESMSMQLQLLRAERGLGACDFARGDLVERRLRSFRREVQRAVRNLARRHSRLADLAGSFAGAACCADDAARRIPAAPVIDLVIKGVRSRRARDRCGGAAMAPQT